MISKEDRIRLEEFVKTNIGFKTILKLLPSCKEVCVACAWIGDTLYKKGGFDKVQIEKISFAFGRKNYLKEHPVIWENAKLCVKQHLDKEA